MAEVTEASTHPKAILHKQGLMILVSELEVMGIT